MTWTILSWDLVNWWLTHFIVHPPWFRLSSFDSPRKKTYHSIRDSGETLGERNKSHQESSRDSLRDFWRDSWRDFSRSPSVYPESRIGLYAWRSARLSPRLIFFTRFLVPIFYKCQVLPAFDNWGKISNEGCFVMTRTNFFRDSANWWLMYFILDLPWSCLSSFNSSPEQVRIFYRSPTAREINQTKVISRWHGQYCPEIQPTDGLRPL